jgi:hypothetical protein
MALTISFRRQPAMSKMHKRPRKLNRKTGNGQIMMWCFEYYGADLIGKKEKMKVNAEAIT